MAIVHAPSKGAPSAPLTAGRDTGVDLIRAFCVIGVVLLHGIMVGVTVTEAGPVFANASDRAWWIVPLSWALQVMPLFFIIGGFAGVIAYRKQRASGGSASRFVAARVHRLLRPAAVTIGVAGGLLALLALAGVPGDLIAVAGFRYGQPLWFLGVFLLCQALLPALSALHDRAPLRTLSLLAAAALTIDAIRMSTGIDGIGFVNLAFIWLTLQQLGFFFADGAVDAMSRRRRSTVAVSATLLLLLTFVAGVYSPDLIANINPPTGALLLVGIVHLCLLSLFRERIGVFSLRQPSAALSAFVNRRTMTIYLWHMPVLLTMAGASALIATTCGLTLPEPSTALWWLGRPLWLATALGLTAVVALIASRFEIAPAPPLAHGTRPVVLAVALGIAAVAIELILGTSPLTAAVAVACMLLALRLSSATHSPRGRGAKGTMLPVA